MSETPDMPLSERLVFTVPETASLIGLSERQVFTLITSGELKAIRIRTSVRVHRRELERYLADLDATQNGSSRRRPRPAAAAS